MSSSEYLVNVRVLTQYDPGNLQSYLSEVRSALGSVAASVSHPLGPGGAAIGLTASAAAGEVAQIRAAIEQSLRGAATSGIGAEAVRAMQNAFGAALQQGTAQISAALDEVLATLRPELLASAARSTIAELVSPNPSSSAGLANRSSPFAQPNYAAVAASQELASVAAAASAARLSTANAALTAPRILGLGAGPAGGYPQRPQAPWSNPGSYRDTGVSAEVLAAVREGLAAGLSGNVIGQNLRDEGIGIGRPRLQDTVRSQNESLEGGFAQVPYGQASGARTFAGGAGGIGYDPRALGAGYQPFGELGPGGIGGARYGAYSYAAPPRGEQRAIGAGAGGGGLGGDAGAEGEYRQAQEEAKQSAYRESQASQASAASAQAAADARQKLVDDVYAEGQASVASALRTAAVSLARSEAIRNLDPVVPGSAGGLEDYSKVLGGAIAARQEEEAVVKQITSETLAQSGEYISATAATIAAKREEAIRIQTEVLGTGLSDAPLEEQSVANALAARRAVEEERLALAEGTLAVETDVLGQETSLAALIAQRRAKEAELNEATRPAGGGGGPKAPTRGGLAGALGGGGGGGIGTFFNPANLAGFAIISTEFRAFFAIQKGITDAISAANQLDKQFATLQTRLQALGQGDQFGQMRDSILSISGSTGVAATQVETLAAEFLGLYGNVGQATQAAEEAAQIIRITGTSASVSGPQISALVDDLGVSVVDIGNSIVDAGNKTGRGVADMLAAMAGVAPVAQDAGLGLNQIRGLIEAIGESTPKSGQAIGEALARIIPAVQTKLPELSDIGFNFSPEARAGDTDKAIQDVLTQWNSVGIAAQQAATVALGGPRFASIISALAKDPARAVAEMNSTVSSNTLLSDANAAVQNTLSGSIDRVKASMVAIGEVFLHSGIVDGLTTMVSLFGSVITGITSIVSWFSSLGGGVTKTAIEIATLTLGLVAVAKAMQGLAVISGLSSFSKVASVVGGGETAAVASKGLSIEGQALGFGGAFSFGRRGAGAAAAAETVIPATVEAEAAVGLGARVTGGIAAAGEAAAATGASVAAAWQAGGVAALFAPQVLIPIAVVAAGAKIMSDAIGKQYTVALKKFTDSTVTIASSTATQDVATQVKISNLTSAQIPNALSALGVAANQRIIPVAQSGLIEGFGLTGGNGLTERAGAGAQRIGGPFGAFSRLLTTGTTRKAPDYTPSELLHAEASANLIGGQTDKVSALEGAKGALTSTQQSQLDAALKASQNLGDPDAASKASLLAADIIQKAAQTKPGKEALASLKDQSGITDSLQSLSQTTGLSLNTVQDVQKAFADGDITYAQMAGTLQGMADRTKGETSTAGTKAFLDASKGITDAIATKAQATITFAQQYLGLDPTAAATRLTAILPSLGVGTAGAKATLASIYTNASAGLQQASQYGSVAEIQKYQQGGYLAGLSNTDAITAEGRANQEAAAAGALPGQLPYQALANRVNSTDQVKALGTNASLLSPDQLYGDYAAGGGTPDTSKLSFADFEGLQQGISTRMGATRDYAVAVLQADGKGVQAMDAAKTKGDYDILAALGAADKGRGQDPSTDPAYVQAAAQVQQDAATSATDLAGFYKAQEAVYDAMHPNDPLGSARESQSTIAKSALAQLHESIAQIKTKVNAGTADTEEEQAYADYTAAGNSATQAIADQAKAYSDLLVSQHPGDAIYAAQQGVASANEQVAKFGYSISQLKALVANGTATTFQANLLKSAQDASNALWTQQESLAAAQTALAQSQFNAQGNPIAAAAAAVANARQVIADILKRNPGAVTTGPNANEDLVAAFTNLNNLTAQQLSTNISTTETIIQNQLTLRQITIGGAIARLKTLEAAALAAGNATEAQNIAVYMQNLINQTQGNLDFNLPNVLGTPTLYQARRLQGAAGAGTGYNDLRTQNIVINIANANQMPGAVNQLLTVMSGAPRSGTLVSQP